MVAANTSSPYLCRKSFPQAFLAFSELARRHDDAWLYLHTDFAPQGIGIDLNVVADLARIPAGRVRYPDPASLQIGIPPQVVACTYQAFDVLLNPAMGEGFGIPILEAQACGVPVIASDHSAMPEITQAGWLVDGDPWLDYIQEAWFFNPSVAGIVDALEQAYAARDDRQLREDAVRFAAQYDADQVADRYWRPALEQLGAGLEVAA
jgi:glycosyltransferase involved in cell wall biosynthesis